MQQRSTSSSSRRRTAGRHIVHSMKPEISTTSVKRWGGAISRQHLDWRVCLVSRPSVVEPSGEQAHALVGVLPKSSSADKTYQPPLVAAWQGGIVDEDLDTMVREQLIAEARRLRAGIDRKSTRLNSSHSQNSYAGFCLKKKKK